MGRRFESCRAHQLLQQLCPVAHPAFGAVERYNTLLYSASLLHRNLQLETLSYDAVNGLLAHGILLVAAAQNGGVDRVGDDNDNGPNCPSNYDLDNIIAVAATDRTDNLASSSNFSPHSWPQSPYQPPWPPHDPDRY